MSGTHVSVSTKFIGMCMGWARCVQSRYTPMSQKQQKFGISPFFKFVFLSRV